MAPSAEDNASVSPGFYAILDTAYVSEQDWVSKGEALLAGGACLLQVRAKGASPAKVSDLVASILPAASKRSIPLIVNDHPEVALAFDGVGVHIGQDDGHPREVRKLLGPRRILGWSTRSLAQASAAIALADTLSYFAVGPVFATGTKPDYRPVGLELVGKVRRLNPGLPFFAIGGLSRENALTVLRAGADGVVAVSDPLQDADTLAATRTYVSMIKEAQT